MLFHGSDNGTIDELKPMLSNHGKEYVYLTDNYVLAILYAHNPLKRPGGFFTYKFKNGKLWYDEYFENQTKVMYKGKKGFIYHFEDDNTLQRIEKMPWVYISEQNIKPSNVEQIDDIYEELLRQEKLGNLVINRHENMSEEEKAKYRKIVENDIQVKELKKYLDCDYAKFLHEHFPELI